MNVKRLAAGVAIVAALAGCGDRVRYVETPARHDPTRDVYFDGSFVPNHPRYGERYECKTFVVTTCTAVT